MTQILARTTSLLDGRKTVKMTGRVYLRAIVPIGLFFSLSLICGNVAYLYLSVAFIQMLKVSIYPSLSLPAPHHLHSRSIDLPSNFIISRLLLLSRYFSPRGVWEWHL